MLIYLLLTVEEEIAEPNVPEVGECCELAVLLLGTLPPALLSGRKVRSDKEFNFKILISIVSGLLPPCLVLVFNVLMRDRPIGLHKYEDTSQLLVVAFPSSSSPVASTPGCIQIVNREKR